MKKDCHNWFFQEQRKNDLEYEELELYVDDIESFDYFPEEDEEENVEYNYEDEKEETKQTIEKKNEAIEETPPCDFTFDKKEFIKYTQPILVQLLSSSNTILRSVLVVVFLVTDL